MKLHRLKPALLALFLLLFVFGSATAQNSIPFQGEVNSDNINIRTDATVGSKPICTVKKGIRLEAISELYDWYKVRLPTTAPSYVRKDLFECINYGNIPPTQTSVKPQCLNAKAIKNSINVRLEPSESSNILGKISKNEVVNITGLKDGWYRIEPLANSYGWIHKKFLAPAQNIAKVEPPNQDTITIVGVVKPYGIIFKREATHKLICPDNKIYLLKGNRAGLDSLNYHKVKVSGKLISSKREKYPIIEISSLTKEDE